jgi:hypothetical protein
LFKLLKVSVETSKFSHNGKERIPQLEKVLESLHSVQTKAEVFEDLFSKSTIPSVFNVRTGSDIGKIYEDARQECFRSGTDRNLKEVFYKSVVNNSLTRRSWKPVSERSRKNIEREHLIWLEDLEALLPEDATPAERDLLVKSLLAVVERKVAVDYLGYIPEQPEKHERSERFEFGDYFSRALATNPEKILSWLEKSFEREGSLAAYIFPELKAMTLCEQDTVHHSEGNVWTHTKKLFDSAKKPISPALAMSLLCHDIGKPATQEIVEADPTNPQSIRRIHFTNHENVGAQIWVAFAERLGCEPETTSQVYRVISEHGLWYNRSQSGKPSRLWVKDKFPNGEEDLLFQTISADNQASVSTVADNDAEIFNYLKDTFEMLRVEETSLVKFATISEDPVFLDQIGPASVIEKFDSAYAFLYSGQYSFEGKDPTRVQLEVIMHLLGTDARWAKEYVSRKLMPFSSKPSEIDAKEFGRRQTELARQLNVNPLGLISFLSQSS